MIPQGFSTGEDKKSVVVFVERVSAVTSPVVMPMWNTFVSPVWNAVCYPLWTHVGRPAYSAVSSSVTSTLAVLQYLVARAILWDTWILSRYAHLPARKPDISNCLHASHKPRIQGCLPIYDMKIM